MLYENFKINLFIYKFIIKYYIFYLEKNGLNLYLIIIFFIN
jgi:hypothetical protein